MLSDRPYTAALLGATVTGIGIAAMTPGMPVVFWIDKGDHVVAFGTLTAVLFLATARLRASFSIAAVAAVLIEVAQGAFPSLGRECSVADLMAGVAAAAGVSMIIGLARTMARRRRKPAMRTIDFAEFSADLERRRAELGIVDTPETLDALRNKGHGRTESKKALLREIARRSREAGVEPLPTYIDGERI
jgi:VanZ family protein